LKLISDLLQSIALIFDNGLQALNHYLHVFNGYELITLTTIAIGSSVMFALACFLISRLPSEAEDDNAVSGNPMLGFVIFAGAVTAGAGSIQLASEYFSIGFSQTPIVIAAEIFNVLAFFYIAVRGIVIWFGLVVLAVVVFIGYIIWASIFLQN